MIPIMQGFYQPCKHQCVGFNDVLPEAARMVKARKLRRDDGVYMLMENGNGAGASTPAPLL